MLGLAALILAAASANASPALASGAPWWDKFTFTMSGDGAQQACQYESSLAPVGAQGCGDGDDDTPTPMRHAASGSTGGYTKITIERRFTPGEQPHAVSLATGETLLAGQVMALDIDAMGKVRSCQIVGTSGDMKAPYGCENAQVERFETSGVGAMPTVRHGIMTVLVYGHEEDLA